MEKGNYILKWCNGNQSGIGMTKEHAQRVLVNWYAKDKHWNHITVVNTSNGKNETFFQDWSLKEVEILI